MSDALRSDIHYQEHTGVLTHKLTQPTENLILERNADLRRNPGAIQDLGAQSGMAWGRQLACIPTIMYWEAIQAGFELNCKNAEHAEKELYRFLNTPKGRECLVQGDKL